MKTTTLLLFISMFIFKLHAFLIKSFRALHSSHWSQLSQKKKLYNIMIKVQQHALINLLCHLFWFKKQSFTLVWKPNPPLRSVCCMHLCARADAVSVGSTHEASRWMCISSRDHWSVKSDSCYYVPWLCSAQEQQTMHLHKCDHVNCFTGRVVRLTAKPRYLLLLHRGNEKYNTVTALIKIQYVGTERQTNVIINVHFACS